MLNSKITSAGADEPNEDVAQNQTEQTCGYYLFTVATSVKIKL